MVSQVNGLAKYINSNFAEKKVILKWPWSVLHPGILPTFKNIFNKDLFEDKLPNIIISCGRRSVYASLYLKKILKKKLISIHIQNPKINFKNFDYIISPNHDRVFGKNVINSLGALHHIDLLKIESSKKLFETPKNKKIISVILGGENKHYIFDNLILDNLLKSIENLDIEKMEYFLIFVPSRRTNKKFIDIIKKKIKQNFYIWDMKSENPYIYSLKIADYIIVTSDSTSMISEACSTGKPVFVFHLPFKRKSMRFEYFHEEFKNNGLTRPFGQKLYTWDYKPLNESKRIARILSSRILKENNE